MHARALTIALRLLTAACAGGALGTLTGCPFLFDCPDPWSALETLALETDADILALAAGGDHDELVAVGAGGVVIHYSQDGETTTSNPVNQTLRAVVARNRTIVVGDGGTILTSDDRGASWEPRSAPVGDDLLGLSWLNYANYVVAIAAEQILVSADEGETWALVEPPAEGWGGLRAVFSTHEAVWVVGADGSAWSASDPSAAWLRQDIGTTTSFLGGGPVSGTDASNYASAVVLASAGELWFLGTEDGASWIRLEAALDGEVVAYGGGYVLTDAGTVYDLDENGYVTTVATVEFDARAVASAWSGFVVAGSEGQAARAYEQFCIGGRPWTIDGQLTTAALDGEIPPFHGRSDRAIVATLVQNWVQDGLYEHASVASFARAATELMSLGAPQELIRACLAAQRDEMAHAEACFGLASDLAGVRLGPGSLPLSHNFGSVSHSRAGRPAAVALAMLEEGCINESLAAAEAAVAGATCTDLRAKSVLDGIARDETRHAALAWRSLRWLLEAYPETVGPALRSALPRLRPPSLNASPTTDARAEVLARHGRLSIPARALIQRRVYAEMITPLATTMLDGIDARVLA